MEILTTRIRSGVAARTRVHAVLAVAVLAALAAVVVAPPPLVGLMVACALAFGIAAAVVDVQERRIPDVLVGAIAAMAIVMLVRESFDGHATSASGSILLAAAVMSVPVFVIHLVDPSAMGFGDVKLAAALGAVIGLADWRWAMVALCVASGATAAVGLVRRARDLPLAPGLVAGTIVALAGVAATRGVLLPWR